MKWANLYFFGYVILLAGIVAALWKTGVLGRVGAGWTVIGIVIAVGIGVMVSAANGESKDSIRIDK